MTFGPPGRSAAPHDGRDVRDGAQAADLTAQALRQEAEAAAPPGEEPMTATYVKVLVVEAVTLVGLWLFQVWFGDP